MGVGLCIFHVCLFLAIVNLQYLTNLIKSELQDVNCGTIHVHPTEKQFQSRIQLNFCIGDPIFSNVQSIK